MSLTTFRVDSVLSKLQTGSLRQCWKLQVTDLWEGTASGHAPLETPSVTQYAKSGRPLRPQGIPSDTTSMTRFGFTGTPPPPPPRPTEAQQSAADKDNVDSHRRVHLSTRFSRR